MQSFPIYHNEYLNIRKNIFACLFSVHNTISLSRHERTFIANLTKAITKIIIADDKIDKIDDKADID